MYPIFCICAAEFTYENTPVYVSGESEKAPHPFNVRNESVSRCCLFAAAGCHCCCHG